MSRISQLVPKNYSIEETADKRWRENNSKVKEIIRESEQALKEECTFKPKLLAGNSLAAKKATAVLDSEHVSENIQIYNQQKERKMENKKKELDYENLKDCSFRPWLNDHEAFENKCLKGQVYVRGLSNHLQKQQNAEKKKEDQEKREKEVFGAAVGGQLSGYANLKQDQNGCRYTKPKPFNIKLDDPERKMKLKEKMD